MIPFLDLQTQHRQLEAELAQALDEVLVDCRFVGGPRVAAFEEAFADFCDTAHAVGTASGTASLRLAMAALNIGPGDEVIIPSHTFIATAEAVAHAGARIVLADVDPLTYTIDPESTRRCLSPQTRAVIPVHLYGQMADMVGIQAAVKCHGGEIAIIEDAAQAHGAKQDRRTAGSIGQIACFSFYPGKNLGACGDAGAVTTDDTTLAKAMARLRDHGRLDKYRHERLGFNGRLDDLQAAVLQVKLTYLEEWNAQRRSRASLYHELLADVPGLTLPTTAPNNEHVFHLYVIQADDRDGLRTFLEERDIATGIHYPVPLHQQPALKGVDFRADSLPVTQRLTGRILSLPMYPDLSDHQVAAVADAVREFQERETSPRSRTTSVPVPAGV